MEYAMQDLTQKKVKVSLFDGELKDEPGICLGSIKNSQGELVHLVEMDNRNPNPSEFNVGVAQTKNGKPWVLSVYPQEIAQISA
jgi:hypothetical protein